LPNAYLVDSAPNPKDFVPGMPESAVDEAAVAPESGVHSDQPEGDEGSGAPEDFVVALATKGFLILTGTSGTGKSRGIFRLAYATERRSVPAGPSFASSVALVPVGADWTDAKKLLGYRNPFGPARQTSEGNDTNETYVLTDAVRLFLRASHPDRAGVPHFLVLDEMNLSHVERYFSPFLSLMEARRVTQSSHRAALLSREDINLVSEVLHDERPDSIEAEAALHLSQAGLPLSLPANLFVVGTVNVDETTYMFSPKVLDRANVIELTPVRPAAYIDETPEAEHLVSYDDALKVLTHSIDNQRSNALAALAPKARMMLASSISAVPSERRDEITACARSLLDGAFKLLAGVGFPFGYRVINECFDYVYYWLYTKHVRGATENDQFPDWPAAMDSMFIQKILPKIHGNRRQLGTCLEALNAFLLGQDREGTPPARYRIGDGPEVAIDSAEKLSLPNPPGMPKSREKLRSMTSQLAGIGYVSFVQ
jgi:hypothetical protein